MRYQKARIVKVECLDESREIGRVVWVKAAPPHVESVRNPDGTVVGLCKIYDLDEYDELGRPYAILAECVELEPEFKEIPDELQS